MASTRFNVQSGLSVGTGSINVIDSEGSATFANLTASGSFTVLGPRTYISSSIVEFGTNFITLNNDSAPEIYGGIYFKDFNLSQTASLIWDSYTNQWLGGLKGSEVPFPTGQGTVDYLVKWTGFSSLAPSSVFDNGTNVGIGTNAVSEKLTIAGGILASGSIVLGSNASYDLGTPLKKFRSVYANYLTGSLTTLEDGTSYLVAGPNMVITTGSNGSILLEATLAAGTVSGVGSSGYLPKFIGASAVNNSNIYDGGTFIGIGVTESGDYFAVAGNTSITGSLLPGADSLYDLGSSDARWKTLYSKSVVGDLTGSGLSNGSVLFAGSGGIVTGSQSNLFWDSENYRLGIGTSFLNDTLTVSGSSLLSGSLTISGSVYLSGSLLPGADFAHDLGSAENRFRNVFSSALTGSLTTLSDGTPYLLAGPSVALSTGSSGAVTVSFSGITSITTGTGLSGGGSTGDLTLAIRDDVVATISGATFSGAVKFAQGLSGSLTSLQNGSPYLIGSTGINASTGSSGAVTLVIKDDVVATVSGATFTGAVKFKSGLSGSLTNLDDGTSYIIAGDNVTITTGSSGAITISSTAGGTINGEGDPNFITKWKPGNELTGSKIYDDGSNVRVLVPVSVTGSLLPGDNSTFNLGSVTKSWNTVYSNALTGSLTRLKNGDPYLVAGSGITLSTGSSGAVTITGNIGTLTNITAGTGLLGGGSAGNATLSIDDSVVATVSGATFNGVVNFTQGLSGSLTRLTTGDAYIVGGSNVTITTGSNGSITIDVVGGAGGGGGSLVDGSGIQNYTARWEDTNTLTYGVLQDDGFAVGIGTSPGGDKLTVSGSASVTGSILPGSDLEFQLGAPDKRWNVFAANISGSLTGSGLVLGSVVFTGNGGLLTGSNSRIFWDNTNSRLGLGTSSPTSVLTVSGTTHFSGSLEPGTNNLHDIGTQSKLWRNVFASNISGSLTGSGLDVGSVVFSSTGGLLSGSNSKLFWDNTNTRLGVGTNSPSAPLEVYGVSGSLFTVYDTMSGSLMSVAGISGIPIFEVFSDFRIAAGGGFGFTTLNISGSTVGIGTSTTTGRFHVYGTSTTTAPVAILQAGVASPTGKVLDVRNSAGTNVASIDHLGVISGTLASFSSNLSAANGSFTGDLTVAGSLTVNGSSTTLNTTSLTVRDNIVVLNASSTPSSTGGIYVNDTAANITGSLIWDSSTDRWRGGTLGNEVSLVTTGSTDSLFNKTLTLTGSTRNYVTGGLPNAVLFFDVTGSLSSSSDLSYNSSTGALTSSIFRATNGFSGSLTTLLDGSSYLIAGSNIIIQTGSNGAITITGQSSGGSGGGSAIGGSGTPGFVAKWSGAIDLDESLLTDNGFGIGVGIQPTGDLFSVGGSMSVTGSLLPGGDAIYNLGSSTRRWNVFASNISGSLTGSGFITGSVVFAGPGGLLTGSNSQLFWHFASSSLGIGTTNPAGKFEVYSAASGSLFAVTDTLSGSLFAVNTISGLSALEVFSDYRVFAGSPAANTLVVNNTTVGIGTSLPAARFQVIGANSLTTPTAIIRAGIASPTAPVLDVQTSTGSPVFFVSGSGNVGIGTAVISYALDVFPTTATARIGQGLIGSWPSTTSYAMFGHSALSHVAAGNYALLQSNVGDTFLNAASTKTTYFRIGNTDIAAFNATGVGIGTTNPGFSLQLGNNASTSTAAPQTISLGGTFSNAAGSNLKMRVWTDGTNVGGFGVSSGQLDYSVWSGASHVWYIAGTEYVRINSTGVGLGTNNPGFRLQLGNNTSASTATPETINMGGTYSSTAASNIKLRIYNDSSSNVAGFGASLNQLDYVAATNSSHVWYIAGSERFRINSTGNVGIGTSTYTARLHVSGSATGNSPTLVVRHGVAGGSNLPVLDVQNSAGTSLLFVSGSGNVGIGATQPAGALQVSGVSGSLFLVTDSITGSLFSVNNVTGLPIFEVFSDNRIVAGRYGQNTLVISGSRIAMGANPVNDIELLISGSSTSSDEVLVVRAGVPSPTGTLIEAQTFTSSSVFWVSGSGAAFFSGSVRSPAFSGSLTTLSDGSPYLVAGPGILLVTQSNGSLYITSSGGGAGLTAGGLVSHVQFNDGGTLGGDANFTFNKTTDTLSVTNISGSLTKLANGADYLVAGSNVSLTTGSNGSITINAAIAPYTTQAFTNVTSLTINHTLGITLYDIEVFDTSYNKIFPKSATATSATQANITFGIPTSGFVIVGGSGGGGGGGISDLGGLSTNISTTGQITGSLVYATGLLTGSSLTTSGPITGSLLNSTSTVTANVPFYLANTTISANYTVPAGFNAMTPGPITISDGVTVTVSDGSTWTVV